MRFTGNIYIYPIVNTFRLTAHSQVCTVLEIMVSIQTVSDHFGILSDLNALGQTFG